MSQSPDIDPVIGYWQSSIGYHNTMSRLRHLVRQGKPVTTAWLSAIGNRLFAEGAAPL
jgi:hypothetical protein